MGLIPLNLPDPTEAPHLFLAPAGSLFCFDPFRGPALTGRCVVPVTGFYARLDGRNTPVFLRDPGRGLMACAAISTAWRRPGQPDIPGFALVTTPSPPALRALEDRIPISLPPERVAVWLSPSLRDPAALATLLAEPPLPMEAVQVRRS